MALTGVPNPSPDDRITIVCLHCDRPQEVGRRAKTMTCKFCSKALRLEDIPVKGYEAKTVVETLGVVTIEKKGNLVVTNRIKCGGLVVRGKVKGHVISRGPVLIGPDSELKGDVTAPSLAVGPGAILDGHYQIGSQPAAPEPSPGQSS